MMPSRTMMLPCGITCPGEVTIRAPTIAWTRGVAAEAGASGARTAVRAARAAATTAGVRRVSGAVRRVRKRSGDGAGISGLLEEAGGFESERKEWEGRSLDEGLARTGSLRCATRRPARRLHRPARSLPQ